MGHLAIGGLATWPMLEAPATRLVGHPNVDVWNHAWGAWWFLESASRGVFPLYTRLLGAPDGGYLWYIDPLGAAFSMPLVALFGVVVAWNLLVYAYVVLASVGGRSLALALGASAASSWFAALAVAISPYLLSEVHNGISEAVGVGWSVLSLAALARATREGAPLREWAWVGIWGGLTAVGTVYYAIGLGLAALPIVLLALGRRARASAPGVILGALVAAAIAVPAFLLVRTTIVDPTQALIGRPDAPLSNPLILAILRHNAVDPRSFFMPGDFQSVDLTPRGEWFLHTSYIGYVAMALALWSRRWTWWVAALLPLVFSLGPFLFYEGDWVKSGSQLVGLPYRVLYAVLPTSALGHPQRTGFPGLAVIYALAAVGLARAPTWLVGGAGLAMAVEFLRFSPAQWPVARTEAFDNTAAAYIRDQVAADPTRAGIVLDLPGDVFGSGMATSRYLMLQTTHGQPLPYTPDVRVSGCKLGNPAAGVLLRRDITGASQVTEGALALGGVRFIVTHGDLADTSIEERILEPVLGEPARFGKVAVFTVDPADFTP